MRGTGSEGVKGKRNKRNELDKKCRGTSSASLPKQVKSARSHLVVIGSSNWSTSEPKKERRLRVLSNIIITITRHRGEFLLIVL